MTLNYRQIAATSQAPLFDGIEALDNFTAYAAHAAEIDRRFLDLYGYMFPLREDFRVSVYAMIFTNADKYRHLAELIAKEYDPLQNFNGHVEWKETNSGDDVTTRVMGDQKRTSTDSVSPYDATAFTDRGKLEVEDEGRTDTDTLQHGHIKSYEEDRAGNLGMTTSQQMAQSELDLMQNWSFWDLFFSDVAEQLSFYADLGV